MRTAARERNYVAFDAPSICYSIDIQRNIYYYTCPIGRPMPQCCPVHHFSWVPFVVVDVSCVSNCTLGPVMTSSNVDAVFGLSCPVTDASGRQTWGKLLKISFNSSGIVHFRLCHCWFRCLQIYQYHCLQYCATGDHTQRRLQRCNPVLQLVIPKPCEWVKILGCS